MQYSKGDIDRWEREDETEVRSSTPEEKLSMAFQLFDMYRDTMRGILRNRFPSATDSEIDRLFFESLGEADQIAA